jgi:ABC-type antimicrobial peptide transport system permease subunit
VNSIDHDQQTNSGTEDLEHWIQDQPEWARGRLLTWLFGAFAALALAMSAVGLYSVVSYSVVQRTNEFGIRMALGAQRTHVLGIVFRSTVASVGSGVLAGIVLTLALSKVMAHWTTDSSSAFNPLVIVGATLVLASVAALACALPARRAAGVDPMKAIRYE